ncbi:MAG: UDP-N-acetylmuramate dehydrogenase [Clostridia bacterium]|nr:UDP-N-acetylmuramate dehydrogenase [Clostridia bacterium]
MSAAEDLKLLAGKENVVLNEPMNKHTTFRIGGSADIFVTPSKTEEIEAVLKYVTENKIPYYIIGNGSNLLVRDKGFRGVIIQLYKNYSQTEVNENTLKVQSGALLSAAAKTAMNHSLKGMECLSGIPGTIGGAVCMNAGAYGGEMKDIVESVRVINKGKIQVLSNEECGFRYRGSRIMDENMIVLEAVIKLEKGNMEEIQSKMKELLEQRNSKQPVELPSAGSTFKRPEGYFAAKLIDESGLRGFSQGNAQVSEKHCGFVVNKGGATAEDVISLMDKVSLRVYEKFGVRLEPEVRIIGEK